MTKVFLYLWLFLFLSCNAEKPHTNKNNHLYEKIVTQLNLLQLDECSELLTQVDSEIIKSAVNSKINYLINNEVNLQFFETYSDYKKSNIEEIFFLIYSGDNFFNYGLDSLSYKFYKKAESFAQENNFSFWEYEAKLRIAQFFMFQLNTKENQLFFNNQLDYLQANKRNSYDDYMINRFLAYRQLINFYQPKNIDKDLKYNPVLFEKMHAINSSEPFFQAQAYQMKSLHQDIFNKSTVKRDEANKLAVNYYRQSTLAISESKLSEITHNEAINLVRDGQYNKAIEHLNSNLNEYQKSSMWIKMQTHKHLSDCYSIIGDNSNAYTSQKLFKTFSDSIKQHDLSKVIYKTNVEYEVKDKDKQIEIITAKSNFMKSQLSFIVPLALLVLGLAAFIYRKYIKTSKEKTIIEEEHEIVTIEKQKLQNTVEETSVRLKQLHSENKVTHQKIDELKKVVTKEFIILKDKTKVYVEELMLIQSDDHYLKVKLDGKKDNFVRGKLSKILTELPPNFKRCHRSYIVNENFIQQYSSKFILLTDKTEVPVSTTYRDQFEEFNN